MTVTFEGKIIYWRGPAPFLFVATPDGLSSDIKSISSQITYGWGAIPVQVRIGNTTFTTSLFPKDGAYLVPIKKIVQDKEKVGLGDVVKLALTVG